MKSALPKVLHQLASRPMIGHALTTAGALKAERVIAVVGPGMESVAEAVAPVPSVVQPLQRGTGDAVRAARDALRGFAGDM